jgi:hypothetical protein
MRRILPFSWIACLISVSHIASALGQNSPQPTVTLIQRAAPAIVKLFVSGSRPDGSTVEREAGTGFIIASQGGFTYIVTAGHVLGSNEKDDQRRNEDWKVENGKIVRKVQLLIPDAHGGLIERVTDIFPLTLALPGADLALFSIQGDNYPTLPIAVSDQELNQQRPVILLGFPADSMELMRPAPHGDGQRPSPDKYITTAQSFPGQSGAPWIDVQSGKVVAIATASRNALNIPSSDAVPIALITSTLRAYLIGTVSADRDAAAYHNSQGDPAKLKTYADTCDLCTYKAAALAEIDAINRQQNTDQARQEAQRYNESRGDVNKLRAYLASCTVCEFKAAANAEIIGNTRQKCDRNLANPFDPDAPKGSPTMRDTAALSDDEIQQALTACLQMQNYSDDRRYLTQAARGYATQATRRAAANTDDATRLMGRALSLWNRAKAAGSGAAMNYLGAYYSGSFNTANLRFVQPDYREALDNWLKAADANNVKAMENAGLVLLAGAADYPPIQRDANRAQGLLSSAARGDDMNAATALGKAFFYGSPPEITQDYARGLAYLTTACIKGEVGARRFFDLEMNRPQYRTHLPATRPAGCDSDTVAATSAPQGFPAQRANNSNYWDYNGSIFELVADGPSRKLYYFTPRDSLASVGVSRGTLYFEGKRTGDTYSGNAYTFARNCGPMSYPVTGTVSADQRSIQLHGVAPHRNANCDIESTSNQTMEFTLRTAGIN